MPAFINRLGCEECGHLLDSEEAFRNRRHLKCDTDKVESSEVDTCLMEMFQNLTLTNGCPLCKKMIKVCEISSHLCESTVCPICDLLKVEDHNCIDSLKSELRKSKSLSIRAVIEDNFPTISQEVIAFIEEK
jgi:hypothetical protein